MNSGYVDDINKQKVNEPVTNITDKYDVYKTKYTTGSQVSLFLGSYWIDDIISISLRQTNSKSPVYGYKGKYYSLVTPGTVLVEGSLTMYIHKHTDLMEVMDRITFVDKYTESKDRIDDIESIISSGIGITSRAMTKRVIDNSPDFQKKRLEYLAKIQNTREGSPSERVIDTELSIVIGNYLASYYDLKVLENIQIIGESEKYEIDDMLSVVTYTFFARRRRGPKLPQETKMPIDGIDIQYNEIIDQLIPNLLEDLMTTSYKITGNHKNLADNFNKGRLGYFGPLNHFMRMYSTNESDMIELSVKAEKLTKIPPRAKMPDGRDIIFSAGNDNRGLRSRWQGIYSRATASDGNIDNANSNNVTTKQFLYNNTLGQLCFIDAKSMQDSLRVITNQIPTALASPGDGIPKLPIAPKYLNPTVENAIHYTNTSLWFSPIYVETQYENPTSEDLPKDTVISNPLFGVSYVPHVAAGSNVGEIIISKPMPIQLRNITRKLQSEEPSAADKIVIKDAEKGTSFKLFRETGSASITDWDPKFIDASPTWVKFLSNIPVIGSVIDKIAGTEKIIAAGGPGYSVHVIPFVFEESDNISAPSGTIEELRQYLAKSNGKEVCTFDTLLDWSMGKTSPTTQALGGLQDLKLKVLYDVRLKAGDSTSKNYVFFALAVTLPVNSIPKTDKPELQNIASLTDNTSGPIVSANTLVRSDFHMYAEGGIFHKIFSTPKNLMTKLKGEEKRYRQTNRYSAYLSQWQKDPRNTTMLTNTEMGKLVQQTDSSAWESIMATASFTGDVFSETALLGGDIIQEVWDTALGIIHPKLGEDTYAVEINKIPRHIVYINKIEFVINLYNIASQTIEILDVFYYNHYNTSSPKPSALFTPASLIPKIKTYLNYYIQTKRFTILYETGGDSLGWNIPYGEGGPNASINKQVNELDENGRPTGNVVTKEVTYKQTEANSKEYVNLDNKPLARVKLDILPPASNIMVDYFTAEAKTQKSDIKGYEI